MSDGADTGPERLGVCPHSIERPVMMQRWEKLSFLHWRFEPGEVQRLLPDGLVVETFDGSAWVGLVPFLMRVWVPGTGPAPWAGRFCETNVRTYARDAYGRSGIWFFSLDAARLGAVLVARAAYRLPYFWSRMRLKEDSQGLTTTYTCRRRWPTPAVPDSRCVVRASEPFQAGELSEMDHFLTARWLLFSATSRGLRHALASHAPWPLHRAHARLWDDRLLVAAGLPPSLDEPIVHYSPGVEVRIGRPRSAGPPRVGRRP